MDSFEVLSYVFMMVFGVLGIICALIFITILIVYRRCRTMTIFVTLNSIIAGFIVNVVFVSQLIYQLTSDGNDKLCVIRGFFLQVGCGLLYHSFCVQAFYRLFATLPERLKYLQSKYTMLCIILVQWLISLNFALPLLIDGRIQFDAEYRICQIPMDDLYGFLYFSLWIYLLPVIIIIVIYIRILTYIKTSPAVSVIHQHNLEQQRRNREFRIYRNIALLIMTLIVLNFPCIIFSIMVQITHTALPLYTQFISYMSMSLGHGVTMLLCLITNEDIRKCLRHSLRKYRPRRRHRRVHCINSMNNQILPIQNL